MGSKLTAIATSFGENILTNADLSLRFGNEVMSKIEKISGISERRIADEKTCSSDIAFRAANLLLGKVAQGKDFDALIFATQTPDYLLPSNACIMQERLKLPRSCAAFDINLGCSQFVYALATAKAWIESKMAKKILILCADTPSKFIHPLDRSAVSLFGDAAAACIVEESDENRIIDFSFGTDGRGFSDLICPTSGMRHHPSDDDKIESIDENGNIRTPRNLFIDGVKIFSFAYKTVPESVKKILKKNGMGVEDIDLFVFHQAGEKIISSCVKKLGINPKKVWYKMHDIGNCGGASVPIALADAAIAGRLKEGMKVAICAFGVGLSWGCSILKWSGDFFASTDADFSKSPAKPVSQSTADTFI